MSSVTRYSKLSDDQLQLLHDICDRFERALRHHEAISIESQIEAAPEDIRTALFRELLDVELESRMAREGIPEVDEYEARFPDQQHEIRRAFSEISSERPDKIPGHIGRYRIEALLGSGGFAEVYLGYDDQLKRKVAIKVPHRTLMSRREDVRDYLNEAQALASLDHSHIVPVHDVGRSDEFPCYVVSKYVEGMDLARFLKKSRLSWRGASELVANIAEALHHAHTRGLVHRDVKPGNILLDGNQNAYLTDFGVALKDSDAANGPRYAGTPAYMSPEQSRGEGHRVDGRSDIYSLGAVFYELLSGQRTFPVKSRLEWLERIASHDPKPPRQIEDSIPKELERICLKALARRARERYTTAMDMAEELRQFLDECDSNPSTPAVVQLPSTDRAAADRSPMSTPADSDSQSVRIVPKGLRAFDEHDCEFFLSLLPGPRNRDGLPESIQFWKTRVEEMDGDETFQVGLIYGPSGCGKSSFVKAGLLPRLSDQVTTVFVESTAGQTESRLLKGLRKHCPDLRADLNLKQAMASLRTGPGRPYGRKVLIVLDQFEQWLHAHKEDLNTELVAALRQCDGARVQCIVLVRDDFWLAITRFMRDLEVELVSGRNVAVADLFDPDHARKVLCAFGRALGRLPEDKRKIDQEQEAFLDQAIQGLTTDGKVVCIRLALFAEMMKGKSWTPATLQEVGGTEGVGVTFLEETLSGPSSNPAHRLHQRAARAVLKALLPESGVNIKGQMKSYSALLDVSGYAHHPDDFDELIRILDNEIRLITPTDPEGASDDDGVVTRAADPATRYYQLTHDYLVHSLRDWLTRKQRETRRGRAELRLSEQAAMWGVKTENRHLPSVWEWATIHALTHKKHWTRPEQQLMHRADRVHGLRWGSGLAIVLLAMFVLFQAIASTRQRHLLDRMQTAVATVSNSRGSVVPYALADLENYPNDLVVAELRERFADGEHTQKVALAYAMAHFGSVDVDFLVGQIEKAPSSEVNNLADALAHSRSGSIRAIHRAAADSETKQNWDLRHRLAIVALYLGDVTLAQDMCHRGPNPIQRMHFFLNWAVWHGDLSRLASFATEMQDPSLRSGVCLGLGHVRADEVSHEVKQAWNPILRDWFQNAPDSGVHSAAEWVQRKWKLRLPVIAASLQSQDGRAWHVNSAKITMLRIPAGSYKRRWGESAAAPGSAEFLEAPLQEVRLTRPFLISDREISVGQYQQMVDDPEYPDGERRFWSRPDQGVSPTADHPIHNTNWNDAVLFCNWLSHKERLTPCYTRTGKTWKIPAGTTPGEFDQWVLDPRADGYRLPTEAEWVYVCRAGATTQDPLQDEISTLIPSVFGTYLSHRNIFGARSRPDVCGTKPPNGWGLFDIHGNLREWCHDWHRKHQEGSTTEVRAVSDPLGPKENDGLLHRVIRDGMFARFTLPLTVPSKTTGFRVARTLQP